MTAPQLTVYEQGQTVLTADRLNTFEQTCDTVSQLRGIIGISGIEISIRGITAPNDGGAGDFYWEPNATGPDNGLSVIVPTGSASGAWVRLQEVASGSPYQFQTTAILLAAFPNTVVLTNGTLALTAGRTTEGDQGGSEFYYDSSDSTSADNGGTIRVDSQGRRWKVTNSAYVTLELFGAKGDGVTNDATAVNAALAFAKGSTAAILPGPKTYLVHNATLDGTRPHTTTPTGLTIKGIGQTQSIILMTFSTPNTSVGFDLTGQAWTFFENIAFEGGTSASDCPVATALFSSASDGGTLVPGTNHYGNSVGFFGYGNYTVYNAGGEQWEYDSSICTNYTTTGKPFGFCATGATPQVTSSIVTTKSPVFSMSAVRWNAAKGGIFCAGPNAVEFHFSSGGAINDIRFFGYCQMQYNAGNSYVFVDSGVGGSCIISNCGWQNGILEAPSASFQCGIASWTSSAVNFPYFQGVSYLGVGSPSNNATLFAISNPVCPLLDWDGGNQVSFAGTVLSTSNPTPGAEITTNGPWNAVTRGVSTVANGGGSTISNYSASLFTFQSGNDGAGQGSVTSTGPELSSDNTTNNTSIVRTIRGGQRSTLSDGYEVRCRRTTVGSGGANLVYCPSGVVTVLVTGTDGTDIFADQVTYAVGSSATTPTVVAAFSLAGSPAARTYTSASGFLHLVMASGSYSVLCQGHILGIPA